MRRPPRFPRHGQHDRHDCWLELLLEIRAGPLWHAFPVMLGFGVTRLSAAVVASKPLAALPLAELQLCHRSSVSLAPI